MLYLYSMAQSEQSPAMEALVSGGDKPKKSRKKEIKTHIETPQDKMEQMLVSPSFATVLEQALLQLEEWNESAYAQGGAHDLTRLSYNYENIDYIRAVMAHMHDPKAKTRRAFTREDGFAHSRIVPDAAVQPQLTDQIAFELFSTNDGLVQVPEQYYMQISRVPGGKTRDSMEAKSVFDIFLRIYDDGAALLTRSDKEPRVILRPPENPGEEVGTDYIDEPLLAYDYDPTPLHIEPDILEDLRGQMRGVYA